MPAEVHAETQFALREQTEQVVVIAVQFLEMAYLSAHSLAPQANATLGIVGNMVSGYLHRPLNGNLLDPTFNIHLG